MGCSGAIGIMDMPLCAPIGHQPLFLYGHSPEPQASAWQMMPAAAINTIPQPMIWPARLIAPLCADARSKTK